MAKSEKENSSKPYRIFATDVFYEDLEELGERAAAQITKKLQEYVYPQLREQPYFGTNIKKLRDYQPETLRYRIGDFRVFYQIDDDERTVILISANDRKDSY